MILIQCLIMLILSFASIESVIIWTDKWAFACDFPNNDLSNVRIAAELCGGKCLATESCTHFTWTNYNGGTCWMKHGSISKENAVETNDRTMVCGVLHDDPSRLTSNARTSKRGIAWPLENNQDSPSIFLNGKISWIYNWSPYKTNVDGIEFVPMLWSTNQDHHIHDFINNVGNARYVLGFNEPERVDQANINPSSAAHSWKKFIEPIRSRGTRLGSPAIASTNDGLNWLEQFVHELEKLNGSIDFLALHWYGRGVNNFINWITSVRQRFSNRYPIWITEFACTSWNKNEPVSSDEINEFMKQALEKLDSLDWVEKYAWFGAQRQLDAALGSGNCLIASDGQLSDLGRKYVHEL